jgi:hypothetical protein
MSPDAHAAMSDRARRFAEHLPRPDQVVDAHRELFSGALHDGAGVSAPR